MENPVPPPKDNVYGTMQPTANKAAPVNYPDATQIRELKTNWHYLSFLFSANHACVGVVQIYASTLLSSRVGYAGSAVLYILTCLSALFLGTPLLCAIGHRHALFVALIGYSFYVALFAIATGLAAGSAAQWIIFVAAAILAGLSAGVLWVTQGGYFGCSVEVLAKAEEGGRQSASSWHAATFAVYYLLGEVALKLVCSFAVDSGILPRIIFLVYAAIAFACAWLCLFLLVDLPDKRHEVRSPFLAAVALWRDPVVWLISPTNLAFGFCAAFMNGIVGAEYTQVQLGDAHVGYFASVTAFTGAAASFLFGRLTVRMGSKGPVILLGSLCFSSIPILVLVFGFQGWRYWLLIPYFLMGAGRAVYESTNRGVFGDFFPGAQSEGAFANQMMQATLSFSICFFFSATLSKRALAAIILVLAALTFPGYLLAGQCRERERTDAGGEPLEDVEDKAAGHGAREPSQEGLRQRAQ